MTIALFYHSLVSDWNHGNAHFLRGIVTELQCRGHEVRVFEPAGGWSLSNLLAEHGEAAIRAFRRAYPDLRSTEYDPLDPELDDVLDGALDGVDLVIAHEWNPPELLEKLGEHRGRTPSCRLLFHDTHHRLATQPERLAALDLSCFDGVLSYGEALSERYRDHGIGPVWTWHEAADIRVFRPLEGVRAETDVIWIGNWGDDERTRELDTFLFGPVRALGLRARAHGVRYPDEALRALDAASIEYRGWIANFDVPAAYARARVTTHIPRRPYVEALPGIPTIRPFEALSCGIPLVCSPWEDREGLFKPGSDYLVARDGEGMRQCLRTVLNDPGLARELSEHGRRTILDRHTCRHRVDELLAIAGRVGLRPRAMPPSAQKTRGPGSLDDIDAARNRSTPLNPNP